MSRKRLLTEYEIDSILSFITLKGIPSETAESVVRASRDALKQQLVSQRIYPEMIPALKKMIQQQYNQCLIQPGECVGVISAQSIGEKQTQTTLNTFHTAGKGNKTVTTGVPRVEELLNATKDPKAVNCFVKMKNYHETIADMRRTIGYDVVEITFKRISKSYEICMNKEPEEWYEAFKILYGDDFTRYQDCISLKLDMDLLYEYKLDLETISDIISSQYSDMACVFSETHGQLDIFVDTSDIDLPEDRLIFIDEGNASEIYMEEVVQPILYKIVICGIPGIENIYFNNDANSFETDGSNFKKLLSLPFIDFSQTISNNMWDIYNTLGVEAVRQFLIEEFMNLMSGINRCHIQLLAEKMTHNGAISSMSRYTMRTEECGPMGRASFEETMDNFLKAGIYGQEETTNGVSASIICGKISQIGTGVCELKIDVEALPGKARVLHDVKENIRVREIRTVSQESVRHERTEDRNVIPLYPQLTAETFKGHDMIVNVLFGNAELRSIGGEGKETVEFSYDTKTPRRITISWNNGIVTPNGVFEGYDNTYGVYIPINELSLTEQGRFMRIMSKPQKILKRKSREKKSKEKKKKSREKKSREKKSREKKKKSKEKKSKEKKKKSKEKKSKERKSKERKSKEKKSKEKKSKERKSKKKERELDTQSPDNVTHQQMTYLEF